MEWSARDLLIHKVQYGEITPREAEAEAARLGLKPLASKPDPASFHPMDEPWWTLVMTVAWIGWRTPEKVRDNYDPYRLECWDWRFQPWRVGFDGPVYEGSFLEHRQPATLPLLSISESYDRVCGLTPMMTFANAKAALWRALAGGKIQATGLDIASGDRIPIPDYKWRDLDNFEERGRDVVRLPYKIRFNRVGFDEVALRRLAVMTAWPPRGHEEDSDSVMRAGTPGRPTSIHFVLAEHLARCERNEAKKGVKAESAVLAQWFRETHPSAPPLTAKAIENKIRDQHRAWRAKTQK
jgi:hypothetical protein